MRIRLSMILSAMLLLEMLHVAKPAVAEPGRQAEAAAACANGGYLYWVGVDGPFRNPGECISFVAQGGTLTAPYLSVEWHERSVCLGCTRLYYGVVSGAGLQPGATVSIVLNGILVNARQVGTVAPDGTFFYDGTGPDATGTTHSTGCGFHSVVFRTLDQSGQVIETTEPPPC
jgi:hypothetical protein